MTRWKSLLLCFGLMLALPLGVLTMTGPDEKVLTLSPADPATAAD